MHGMKRRRTRVVNLIITYLSVLIAFFVLAAAVTVSQVRILSIENALQKATWPAETLLSQTFGNENAAFLHVLRSTDRPKSLGHLAFESMTDLRFDDIRSLFGSEIPGFSIYNTKIFAAGEGLNFNNLPQDNPPQIKIEAPKKPAKVPGKTPVAENKLTKKVLLYQTHYWESYKPANNGLDANTTNPNVGVFRAGNEVAQVLLNNGIGSLHPDPRNWGANTAYASSRQLVRSMLKQNPSLTYLIDIHRDSLGRSVTTMKRNSNTYARISFIVGETNPGYTANLYFAKQLKAILDKHYPGIVRGIVGKTKFDGNGIYNQDLSKNAILIEIGGVDNTLAEVDRSSKAVGEALSEYIKSAKK
ncbi:stage II sporulation protein P [Sporolactobacillus vineae]|uniref:stage II sporulation protein P n=1 Tax=Sporolactobacillus vineae TaxID=444463 RepID=UPI00028880A5|nr:stage II sporulation protein P [Sporolactobacillus vineae]